MAQDTRGDLAVTRLNLWLSYDTVRQLHQVERRPLEERLEIEMQLMEVDAAARSLPHKRWQERRLQERLHGILDSFRSRWQRRSAAAPITVRRRYRRRGHRPSNDIDAGVVLRV